MKMRKRLQLKPKFRCYPLWLDGEIFSPIDPETLPISVELKNSLNEWNDRYQSLLNMDYQPLSGFQSDLEEKLFMEEGCALAKWLQNELEDSHMLIYCYCVIGCKRDWNDKI